MNASEDTAVHGRPLTIAVFVGTRGRGSNLMYLHAAASEGRLAARIALAIGTRPDAPALERARAAGLPTTVIDPKTIDDTAYGEAILTHLRAAEVDTIVLAGYLRRLPPAVVAAFPHRIINVHPALLPSFGGKGMYGEHVHRAVIDHGCKVSGCTVHFVDETYDTGPIILQRTVPVLDDDTPESLSARILPHEHAGLAKALELLADGRLVADGRRIRVIGSS